MAYERVVFDPLVRLASGQSCWKGLHYFRNGRVRSFSQVSDMTFEGIVDGSEGRQYHVHIDVEHPRKSHCDCPFAEGRRVICKHQVALYFATHSGADKKFETDCERANEEYERYLEEEERQRHIRIERYVNSLTKAELREQLLSRMLNEDESTRWRWDW